MYPEAVLQGRSFLRRDSMKNVIIIGATGFGGLGLIELLTGHPDFSISQLIARKDTGIPVSNVFSHLKGFCDYTVYIYDEKCSLVVIS